MVKKLFKHEYLAWLRVLPIIYGITLVIAAALRIIVIFENDSVYYGIVLGSAVFMFVVAMITCVVSPTVFSIWRFYKNMFTGEGYLTHTLPVKASHHLLAKVVTAVSFSVISVVVCMLAGMIATIGELLSEIFKAADYLLAQIPKEYVGHMAGWAAEYALALLIAAFASHLFFYLCICIGQLFRKNRVLAAVGVYFGFYMITQVISTIFIVVFATLVESEAWQQLLTWIEKHPEPTIHIFFGGIAVLGAIYTLVCYLICHHIVRKKLNLE